ncbi:predicted protein [Histoplasma mississippiense (nom. inval.)]|uniref:predicted protein n=1 Tax=Ajellomyces capsulatus (strain NAm1 / WU24) TaxID=2059318 RepID=UPI000157C902|nr:predicted protein [Histoplasma mississippiense (nom. inval.)]EDN09436.1 predicted protein [Histoplasma mississippiense (nom. inval.)]
MVSLTSFDILTLDPQAPIWNFVSMVGLNPPLCPIRHNPASAKFVTTVQPKNTTKHPTTWPADAEITPAPVTVHSRVLVHLAVVVAAVAQHANEGNQQSN